MEPIVQFRILGISLVLGLLVGLQREVTHARPAGFRTFPMITLFGTMCGLLSLQYGPWIPALGFVGMLVLSLLGNFMAMKAGESDPGVTTEVAVLLMYVVGVYLVVGSVAVGVVVGGTVAILLHLKRELHGIASRLESGDLTAIMQFVLVTFIVLPVVPDRTYGPLSVFNPFTAWLMVVLIVGISLAGYLIYRFVGARAGVLTGGFLGGLISSTATTISYSRLVTLSGGFERLAAVVIVVASTVLYVRVLILIGLVSPVLLTSVMVPVVLVGVFPAIVAVLMWRGIQTEPSDLPAHRNPAELKTALTFGILYSVVLILIAAAREYFGERELFLVAAISGLADVDAATLSTAQLVEAHKLQPDLAWRMIVTVLLANTLSKAGLAFLLGGRRLFGRILLPFGVSVLVGLLVLVMY